MDNLYLDGTEGLVITVFLSHIVYHFLSSEIITNGNTLAQTMIWTPYVEVLNVIGGIRVFHWSKLGLSDKLRILSQRIIYYQITHLLFIVLNIQLPDNVYFPTFSNMLLLQCFSKLRYDMYDLFTIYSQVFQNYNVIFLFSKLIRSKKGLFYQLCIISTLILFRCVYVVQRIQTDDFTYYPQQFLTQGYQETLSAFLVFLAISLQDKAKKPANTKCHEFHTIILIIIVIYATYTILCIFYTFSRIKIVKQQWALFSIGYIFLRPIYISLIIALFQLVNLSPTIRKILSHQFLSKFLYLPRMFQISLVCIIWQILLVNLSHMQIGPSDPVIITFIVIGFMALVQIFAIVSFYLITPIIIVIFGYFGALCDDLSSKVLLVNTIINAKFD